MSSLLYSLDDKVILTLENLPLEKIDKITSYYIDSSNLINNIKYNDKIGLYLYDNDIDEDLILKGGLILQFKMNNNDKKIITSKVHSLKKDTVSFNIFYHDNYKKIKELEESVVQNNPKLKDYLFKLRDNNHYYVYLRILSDYYNKQNYKKTLIKKLTFKK